VAQRRDNSVRKDRERVKRALAAVFPQRPPSNECLGSAYKAQLYGDGEAAWTKEVTHPTYTSNRWNVDVSNKPLEGRWVGFKAVMYNFVENGKTHIRMELYIDDDVTDSLLMATWL
jgi:hypothetical protein